MNPPPLCAIVMVKLRPAILSVSVETGWGMVHLVRHGAGLPRGNSIIVCGPPQNFGRRASNEMTVRNATRQI
jgi:hypothetical protein